ncbi:hypothetical protein ABAZ39_18880 (plasmid) [Azospirillum argentinense]|uniref:Prohead serine protease domain-containing protein n=1 Tax=Azospirillum argentinense TaxID=2970906 RepID=A0A060DM88_9PROT|nr:hypothetical protein ABAZ39_18880 [Azospirillum argentinense]EZQ05739.1 peptidase [Azospirillum argentinense]
MTTPSNDPASAVSTRAASLAPSTLNADRREVEVTASSGADVRRVGMRPDATWGAWRERLDVAGVDLSRFTGASVLRDHRPSTDAVVGSVLSARKAGGELRAMLTFDTTDAGELAFQQVQQGSIRQVSLGYFVQEWAAGPSDDIAEPLFIARRWQPVEISIVAIGADPAARTRSAEGTIMSTQTTPAPAPQHQPAPATDTRAELLDHILSRATCPQLALPPDMVQRAAADPTMTIQRFNEMVVDHVAAKPSNQRNINPHVQMYDSYDDPVTTRAFMAEALAARLAPGLVKPGERAREYMGCSAMGMIGELLAARGENVNRLNTKELMKRVHTTSDFPLLLESAANKVLLAQYAAASPTYRLWAARRGFNDFKPAKFLRVGDFPSLKPMAEVSELNYGTMSENRETVSAKEYASGIILSRQTLVNDDLGALGDYAMMIGVRTAADENRMVYGLLNSNPVLADGKALFHAAHGNLAAGAAINVESVGKAVALLRKQKSLDDIPLNLAPRFLVVGPDGELAGRQLLAAIVANQSSAVNPWAGLMELVVDANIEGTAWHLFADPSLCPSIVFGYVGDAEGPQILTESDFDTQAVKVRASIDFGYGAIDHRGAVRNPGAPAS